MTLHDVLLIALIAASLGFALGCVVGVHGIEKRLKKSTKPEASK